MTTATGDFAVNFAALANADPYSNANFTPIDSGLAVQILSSALKPSNTGGGQFGLRRFRYNGAMQAGAIIRAKVEIGNAASGDEDNCAIIDSTGAGYLLQINATAVGIRTVNAAGTTAGLVGATATSAASGDVFVLELNQATHTLVGYLNGTAISGFSVTDSTYTTGLAFGFAFDSENSNASTIKSFAGDGISLAAVAIPPVSPFRPFRSIITQ